MPDCRKSPSPFSKSSSDRLQRAWRHRGVIAWLLAPLAVLFGAAAALRRLAWRSGWLQRPTLAAPVVVIGNIVVGGAGKTPLTLWLAQRLVARGRRPGIVSRGYGRDDDAVRLVDDEATPAEVGDEPLLLARRSGCPVAVGGDRVAAARLLLEQRPQCDMLLCDDGLQHYRLRRDVEIAVVDGRGLQNGWLLPAGPLREPARRLREVDAVVWRDHEGLPGVSAPAFRMRLQGERFYRLGDAAATRTAADFAGMRLHAVAGVAEPQRFFTALEQLGLTVTAHPFADHHRYVAADFAFSADAILTTEKDALKCAGLTATPIWVLPVDAEVAPDLDLFVLEMLDGCAPA